MADVFISYKHQDRDRAERLADALVHGAFSVWWDRDLAPSEGFRQAIRKELTEARCVIVLWSVHSIDETGENFVLDEVAAARDKLLQACIDDVTPPMGYGQTQRVSLVDWAGDTAHAGYQDLLRGLSLKLGRPFTALSPQRRALLVGIDQYEHRQEFPVAGAPVANADALARALAAAPGGGFKTQVLANAKWDALDSALKTMTQQTATNDLALLYFSGYAELTKEDGMCLCAADTRPDSLDRTGIPLAWLSRKILNGLAAEHVVIILDCDCAAEASLIERQLIEDLGHGKGKHVLALMVPVAATGSGAIHRNAFTRALAEGLSTFGADGSSDGIITLDEWFEHACRAADIGVLPFRRSFDVPAGTVEVARRPVSTAVPVPAQIANPETLDRVQKSLRRKMLIPFIGDGIYGNGPLSGFEIVKALTRESYALRNIDALSLATVAEYHVETRDDREEFLGEFRRTLADQMTRCKPRRVHDFVLALKSPWLVISSTYDWLLEQRLEQAGQRFTVVSHVLRSREGERDGHLAVVRFGAEPRFETCLADQLLLDEKEENVVYKVLGSPFVHDYADPATKIDTVVVTETDHSAFLARLDNQAMRVPTAFSRPLQSRQLLFLGYNLDIWHYRLVGHVFSKDGPAPVEKAPFAVRQPTSAMEESFWKRLGADMIKTDADTFIVALEGQTA